MSEAHEEEASIWEHIEELAVRLRRIVIAVIIGTVIAFVFPVQALELLAHLISLIVAPLAGLIASHLPHLALPLLPHTNDTHAAQQANTTIINLLREGLLACNVSSLEQHSGNITLTLSCRLLHNSTRVGAHGHAAGGWLDFPLPYEYWTPLVIKLPQLIVAMVVPREVYIAGKVYPVVLMPADAFEVFKITLTTAIFIGIVLASPVIVREVWAYVEPALYPHEKRLIKRYSAAFFGLFFFGVAFALIVVAPLIYRITLSLYPFFTPPNYQLIIRVSVAEVVEFTFELAAATGLLFEIPLVLYILLTHEIIGVETVERNMKYIFLASMILGAIISPDPSGLGMLVIGFTVYLPIHIAVKLARRSLKRKKRGEAKEEAG